MAKIGVLGAGTFGSALARMLSLTGNEVTVWARNGKSIDEIIKNRRHANLPGVIFPEEIVFTKSMEEVCRNKDIYLFAVPSVGVRETAKKAAPYIPAGSIIVDVAKGIEADTLKTMTELIADELHVPARLVALSGPTHAEEVALDLPTTIVSASADPEAAAYVRDVFSNPNMRVYTNSDIKGVELCGAVKNIMAIASGISVGLGYGDNAKAALITRGMAEITRLGLAMGCVEQTFAGLAGMGDLIVTATSEHSRNNRCGRLIGSGCRPDEAVKKIGMVVEGINAIPAVTKLAEIYDVEMPLVFAVDAVVSRGADPRETVMKLMRRELISEEPKRK